MEHLRFCKRRSELLDEVNVAALSYSKAAANLLALIPATLLTKTDDGTLVLGAAFNNVATAIGGLHHDVQLAPVAHER